MVNPKYFGRKFLLVGYITLFSSFALSWGWLSGGEFATIASVSIGAFAAADAANVHSHSKAEPK